MTARPPAAEPAPETKGRAIRWWAGFYDAASWLLSLGRAPAIRRTALDLADVTAGEKVLDVGCGTGSLALDAKAKVGPDGDVHGIDASPEMIGVARRKAARKPSDVHFQTALIEDLPFPDAQFDAVLSSFMLHHLPDDVKRKGFSEIRRVLKPGGRFLAVDLTSHGHSVIGHVMSLFGHRMDEDYTQRLQDMMSEAGFASVEELTTGFKQLAFLRGTT